MEGIENFEEELMNACNEGDMIKYANIVNNNLNLVNLLGREFWSETFSDSSYEEVSFWINFKDKIFNINDLYYINPKYNDLFMLALDRSDIDMNESDIAIDRILDNIDEIENPDPRVIKIDNFDDDLDDDTKIAIFKDRIDAIKKKINNI